MSNDQSQAVPQQNQQPVNMRAPEAFDFTKPETWLTWEKRFLRFITVANLSWKTSKEKTDWLCYTMGQQSEEILLTILPNSEVKSFDEVLEAFRDYFMPKKNIIFARSKFNARVQLPGESVDSFISALYSLAEKCDYSTVKEDMIRDMIRDRIVIGIRDNKTSERLKLKSDLTLASAITEVRQAAAEGQVIAELTSISASNKNKNLNSNVVEEFGSDKGNCNGCGLPRHPQGELCALSNSSCRKRRQHGHGDGSSGAKKVHCVEKEASELEGSEDVKFCLVSVLHSSGQSCSITISANPAKNINVDNVGLLGFDRFANSFTEVLANMNFGNLVTSPLSTQILLAMAAYGAGGDTATQMRTSLQLPEDDNFGQSSYQSLLKMMKAEKGVELHIANKIFIASHAAVKPAYQKLTTKRFLSSTQHVDFTKPEAAANAINTWFEKQTNKRIANIFEPASFTPDTVFVLINAVYFKGQWKSPFEEHETQDRPFHIDAITTKLLPIMRNISFRRFGDLPKLDARFIEIPYKGGNLSLIIILPNSLGGLKEVQDNLHELNLKQSLQQVHPRYVILYLPKFKIESTFDLQPTLTKLGMTTMFQREADFSGITEYSPINVIEVVQAAMIEVDETGTEAAAESAQREGEGPLNIAEFRVNQPFYFVIYEHTAGAALLTGMVKEPACE